MIEVATRPDSGLYFSLMLIVVYFLVEVLEDEQLIPDLGKRGWYFFQILRVFFGLRYVMVVGTPPKHCPARFGIRLPFTSTSHSPTITLRAKYRLTLCFYLT